ncbi:sugar lactone lactonase YvrE [Povalibacter uvarum]|uniref:Sugar lactone lactonase YvrE n=1 Tax=Povalibacter uvarum TaxID=732238 RepID=A0A841HDY5_9GAMM|nr:SMP-30/gluconolactonase/LRE family protein [Povalibacter uvarum]MBB6091311.1 sugar lactone lactonase YvrE [Povalibacter uvarum]
MADAPTVRLISDAGATIGESPAWLGDRVRWTDPVSRRLLTVWQGELDSIEMSASIWSLAAWPDGGLIGSLDDRFCSVGASGEIDAGPAAAIDAGCRFNDMTVDQSGGLWVGMMHRGILSTRGAIFHAPSLRDQPQRVARGLGVPNGMKFSADGRTLYVVDTLERTLLAYPANAGALGEPIIVSDFLGLAGKPDGMTIAPDGTFWVAMWGGSCVVQLAADGAYLRSIAVPAPHVSSVCFAGSNRLLVTTSRMRLSPQALIDRPASGGLFEVLLEAA